MRRCHFESQSWKATLTIKACTKQGFFPISSFLRRFYPRKPEIWVFFPDFPPFPQPRSQEVTETCPSCLFPPHPLALAQAQTSSLLSLSLSLASQPVSCLCPPRALTQILPCPCPLLKSWPHLPTQTG